MTRKEGHFLPSLALALAAHALLLLLLSRALPHQVFQAPAMALDIQVATAGPVFAGGAARGPAAPANRSRASAPPAAPPAAPAAEVPRAPTPPAVTPQPREAPPAAPPADEGASMFAAPAVAAPAASAAPPATPSPAASGSGGASAGVDTGGAGGSGIESADSVGGTGVGTYRADIDPTLMQQVQVSYPAAARRLGQEGTVKVLVEVDAGGRVTSEEVYASSGHRLLDSAALEAVRKARFFPALKNGRPVVARILVPVRFRLTE